MSNQLSYLRGRRDRLQTELREISAAILEAQSQELRVPRAWIEAAQEYVDRVEAGKDRAGPSYERFKTLLAADDARNHQP